MFSSLFRSFEQQFRIDICKKLNELIEIYIKSNTDENSFDELLTTFDFYITQIQLSKTRHNYRLSDSIVRTISPSLKSLQSIS